jgi:hypothetical protein
MMSFACFVIMNTPIASDLSSKSGFALNPQSKIQSPIRLGIRGLEAKTRGESSVDHANGVDS